MDSSSGSPYRVVALEVVRTLFREWGEEARLLGVLAAYVEALRGINQRLATDPLDWGDPLYRLRFLRLQVFRATYLVFHVYYAVDEENRIVYAKDIRFRPGLGLNDLGGEVAP